MKRGYFFSIDIFVALLIIVSGMYLIFTNMNPRPDVERTRAISSDISDFLFDIQIKEICWGQVGNPGSCDCRYSSVASLYCNTDYHFDPEMNLFEVIAQVYVLHGNSGLGYIDAIIEETVYKSKLVPENYNFSITLTDMSVDPNNATRIYPI